MNARDQYEKAFSAYRAYIRGCRNRSRVLERLNDTGIDPIYEKFACETDSIDWRFVSAAREHYSSHKTYREPQPGFFRQRASEKYARRGAAGLS